MTQADLIVVGAGAAGLMAAGQAAAVGMRVALVDRNARAGRKIVITGKGRCNVTNNCDFERLTSAVVRNSRFLYSAFRAFSPQDTMAFFESCGVALKTERGARVFPQSDKSSDIVDALAGFAKRAGASYIHSRVTAVDADGNGVRGVVLADSSRLGAPAVLLATGGLSYPSTGSTGDGYRLAAALGHTVVSPSASIVPIETVQDWCGGLMGLSLKNVTLRVEKDGKTVFSELGELMFTHFGLSGPLVLSASARLEGDLSRYRLFIDTKPGLSEEQLDLRILRDFSDAKNRAFHNSLDRLLPRRLIGVVVALSGIDARTQINAVTRAQRAGLVKLLKNLPIDPAALRPVEEAVVTRGGIATNEIDPKTMQSKLVHGLYFAGEIIDVDAVTGGFNLQIAFSTGYAAAKAAADAVLSFG